MSSETESTARNKGSGIGAGIHPKGSFSRNQGVYDVQNFCTSNQYLTWRALFSFFIDSRCSKDSSWAALSSTFSVVSIPLVNLLPSASLCPFFYHSFSILPKALCLLSRAAQAALAWKNKAKHSLDTSFLHTSLPCVSCQPVTVKLAAILKAGSISLGHSEWMIKMFMRLSFPTIRNLTRSPSSHQCDSHPCSCGYNDAAVEQMFSTSDVPCADVLLVIAWVD